MIHEQPRSWPIKSVHDWKPLIWARDAADIFTPIHVALATWGMVIHGYVIFLELPNLMVDFGDPSGRIHCYSDQISSTSNMWKSHPATQWFVHIYVDLGGHDFCPRLACSLTLVKKEQMARTFQKWRKLLFRWSNHRANPSEWIWNGLMLVSYPKPGTKAIPNPILSYGCVDVALQKEKPGTESQCWFILQTRSAAKLTELDDGKILTGKPYIWW